MVATVISGNICRSLEDWQGWEFLFPKGGSKFFYGSYKALNSDICGSEAKITSPLINQIVFFLPDQNILIGCRLISRIPPRQLEEKQVWVVLASARTQGGSNLFSLMVLPTYCSAIQEAHLSQVTVPPGWGRQLQAILKRRKNPPQSWFGLKQSCNPLIPMSSQTPFPWQAKLLIMRVAFVTVMHSVSRCVPSARGCSKMHLHPLPLGFAKVLPLMPTVISGLRTKRLCCSPWIQKNCHNLRSIGHH